MTSLADMDATGLSAQLELLRLMSGQPNPPLPEEIAALIVKARSLGNGSVAAQAWALARRSGSDNLLPDAAFADIDGSPHAHDGMLGWHRTDIEGLSPNQAEPGEPASFAFDGATPGVLLYQDIWLAPGHYQLAWQRDKMSEAHQKLLSFSINCGDASHSLENLAAGQEGLEIVIPETCPAQRLQLTANGVNLEGEPVVFRFAGLSLSRL
jgi:hypothetical protein